MRPDATQPLSATHGRSGLRARWLGLVPYRDAEVLQQRLHGGTADSLLLLEHPHVYTLGARAGTAHLRFDGPAPCGAAVVVADRGGDVTYHGPGQLVGYPIVSLAGWRAGQRDIVGYVRALEQVLIDTLDRFGVQADRCRGYPGVWIGDEKVAAIGVRVANGRTKHGFALNVDPDLAMFDHIVPCGITDRGVTSLCAHLGDDTPAMTHVVDAVIDAFARRLGFATVDRRDGDWSSDSDERDPGHV